MKPRAVSSGGQNKCSRININAMVRFHHRPHLLKALYHHVKTRKSVTETASS